MTGDPEESNMSHGPAPPLANGERRPEVEEELRRWYAMNETEQLHSLRAFVKGPCEFSLEALVHISRQASTVGDCKTLNLAFEALNKEATPLLLYQARRLTRDERFEQVQEVLLQLFKAIRADKADFAESNFAAFALRRAISLYRKWKVRFEGVNQRVEPTNEFDPLDDLPVRMPSAEVLALLAHSLDKLPPKHLEVFIQYYRLGMTQQEIAEHHRVTVRSVHNWLKSAKGAMGLSGGKDDC